MIGEQTQNTGEKVELKPSKELSPESLQDPTDPDATYRTKGVEGIPSILRRRYNIDNLPIRGLVRSKFWLGFKISAINCKRLIKSRLLATRIALFPLFYNHLLEIFSFQRAIAIKIAA
jgi:hypothetical protein